MKKLMLCSLIIIGFSCNEQPQEQIMTESSEILLFKQSDFYQQLLALGYTLDFNSAEISSDEFDQKLIKIHIKDNQSRKDNNTYVFVFFDENDAISNSFILDYSNEPSKNYTGNIVLFDYKNNAKGEIEFINGQVLYNDEIPQVEKCADLRHVMYCAAERIDKMNPVEKTVCYVAIVECLAVQMASCMYDGCPFQ